MIFPLKKLYLDLLEKTLTCTLWDETYEPINSPAGILESTTFEALQTKGFALVRKASAEHVRKLREQGVDWPLLAETMIGLKRLRNIRFCVEDVLARNVPGDLIETGVWRGGATIYMRAILAAHGVTDRRVWVCDSFRGLPAPNAAKYPADARRNFHKKKELAVSLEQVRANFQRYGLLDNQVWFVKGWFRDMLPKVSAKQFAVVRLDGDLYESTMDGLAHLYPRLSPGGYLIVDDYNDLDCCRQATDDYRKQHGITEPMHRIDWSSIYWRRAS